MMNELEALAARVVELERQVAGLMRRKVKRTEPVTPESIVRAVQDSPAYRGLDVWREWHKFTAWCERKGRPPTEAAFFRWMNKCEPPVVASLAVERVAPREPWPPRERRAAPEQVRKILKEAGLIARRDYPNGARQTLPMTPEPAGKPGQAGQEKAKEMWIAKRKGRLNAALMTVEADAITHFTGGSVQLIGSD